MRITKLGHACVRLEQDGVALVLDPGVFTDPGAVDGASAVLVTHQHPDHLDVDNLRATDARVFTIPDVAEQLRAHAPDVAERVTVVRPGETFDAGLPVRAVGALHALIHPAIDRLTNCGYVVSGDLTVFHPGDALTRPGGEVDVLCVPSSAPWLRSADAVDLARAVGAPRSLAIHDRVYSEAGHGMLAAQMETLLPEGQEYVRLADGTDL